jgi:hypothetical protein
VTDNETQGQPDDLVQAEPQHEETAQQDAGAQDTQGQPAEPQAPEVQPTEAPAAEVLPAEAPVAEVPAAEAQPTETPDPYLSAHTFIQRTRPRRVVADLLLTLHGGDKKSQADWQTTADEILDRPAGGEA